MTPSSDDQLAHVDAGGRARMVDVSGKDITIRTAVAEARIHIGPQVAEALRTHGAVNAKGPVLETARIAGIMAAKRTAELIPMCHPLLLDQVQVEAELAGETIEVRAVVRCTGRTGVEIEAMTAASVAALTIYDMCKSAAKGIVIERIRLLEKTGGRSGTWRCGDDTL